MSPTGYTMKIESRERWIEVRIPPDWELRDLLRAIDDAPACSDALLVDATAVRLSDPTAHALIGDAMGAKFKASTRVAFLVPESIISYNVERAAKPHGLVLRTFVDRQEAERWVSA
jgi:hypothetical protein